MALHLQGRRTHGRLLPKLAVFLLLTAAALAAAMAWHTWRLAAAQKTVDAKPGIAVNTAAAAAHLSRAVQLPTIWTPEDAHAADFEALHVHLEASFPAAHAVLQRQVLGRHALLYTWPGSDAQAAPIALLAHQDVVPVAPGTEHDWQAPPYSGAVQGGYVWGRGAWDDKGNLMAIMEAVDALARAGFHPRQTIYLAFGADEEVGGEDGAASIAALLRQRGVKLRFALDEGLLITHDLVPGVAKPVALIGMAEKGYMTIKLTARSAGGHSSMPPAHSAIGVLAQAVARVEAQPMPAKLEGLPREMFEAVAPEVAGVNRWLLSNLWLTRPLVASALEKVPSTNAMLRTTAAVTVINGGERENVLPGMATASINYRLLPGDSADTVLKHLQRVLAGLDVTIEKQPKSNEPSGVSSTSAAGYQLLSRSLRELQPGVVVAPGLLMGGTDSRHYAGIAQDIYRFSPVHAGPQDIARFHGSNERVSVANYVEMIQFYERVLRNANDLR